MSVGVAIAFGCVVCTTVGLSDPPSDAPAAPSAVTSPEAEALELELRTARARASKLSHEWHRPFETIPFPNVGGLWIVNRVLRFDDFIGLADRSIPDPRQRLAALHAYADYLAALTGVVEGPYRSHSTELAELTAGLMEHEPAAVDRYCGDLMARATEIMRRWERAERSFLSTLEPFVDAEGAPTLERWAYDWMMASEELQWSAPPWRVAFATLITDGAGPIDDDEESALVARLARELRAKARSIAERRREQNAEKACQSMRIPMKAPGHLAEARGEAYFAIGRRMAADDRSYLDALRAAVEEVASAMGGPRGDAIRARYARDSFPHIHPDPTALAPLELRLREVIGDTFDSDEDLVRLFAATTTRRREWCARMEDAYLVWCADQRTTASSDDLLRYSEALLEAGRARIALAKETIAIVRNRFRETPHEAAVVRACDELEEKISKPAPTILIPGPGPESWRQRLDFASPDDAMTQILRDNERVREAQSAGRAEAEEAYRPIREAQERERAKRQPRPTRK